MATVPINPSPIHQLVVDGELEEEEEEAGLLVIDLLAIVSKEVDS